MEYLEAFVEVVLWYLIFFTGLHVAVIWHELAHFIAAVALRRPIVARIHFGWWGVDLERGPVPYWSSWRDISGYIDVLGTPPDLFISALAGWVSSTLSAFIVASFLPEAYLISPLLFVLFLPFVAIGIANSVESPDWVVMRKTWRLWQIYRVQKSRRLPPQSTRNQL